MRRILTATTGIIIAFFGQASLAQPGPPSFDSLDTDENGELSLAEVTALVESRAANRRGDGAGRGDGRGPNPERMLSRWDADGNGSVSREEFDNRPRPGGAGGRRGN